MDPCNTSQCVLTWRAFLRNLSLKKPRFWMQSTGATEVSPVQMQIVFVLSSCCLIPHMINFFFQIKENSNIFPKHLVQQVELKPMPLTIWVNTLPSRPPTPFLPWHPYPRVYWFRSEDPHLVWLPSAADLIWCICASVLCICIEHLSLLQSNRCSMQRHRADVLN